MLQISINQLALINTYFSFKYFVKLHDTLSDGCKGGKLSIGGFHRFVFLNLCYVWYLKRMYEQQCSTE